MASRTRLSAALLCAAAPVLAALLPALLTGPARAQQERAQPVVHQWKRLYYGTVDGEERLLFVEDLRRPKPAFGDLDGDGDEDLVLGTAAGRLMVFERRDAAGDGAGAPRWRLVNDALNAEAAPEGGRLRGRAVPVDVGANAAPVLVDIDADDDLDLFVGSAEGPVHFFRNEGNRYLMQLVEADPDFLDHDFGHNTVPRFGDANGDGILDLALGNERGEVYLLRNRGTRFRPGFCLDAAEPRRDCPAPPEPLLRVSEGDNAVPAWVDWDGDGDPDLMVGRSDGRVEHHRNIGTAREGLWERATDRFQILDAGGYASPAFRDLDGDGRPDLFLAGSREQIPYYRNRAGRNGAELFLVTDNVLRVQRLGRHGERLRLASGDLFGNGRPDLVLGTGAGQLIVYRNRGADDAGQPRLESVGEPILPTPQRAFSAPALVDLDGDGDLDLVVGDRNGRLALIRNTGGPEAPRWRIETLFFAEVDVGAMSVPQFHDFEGDGDPDLVVGNSLGNLVFYQNRGSGGRPDYTLRSVRFAALQVPGHAAPAVFGWNPEGPAELVSGTRDGLLVSAARHPAAAVTASDAWSPRGRPWSIRVSEYSAPHFLDLSGDGRPDLLIGTGPGTLGYWRYEGSQPARQVAAAEQAPPRNALPETEGAEGFVLELEEGESAPNDLERQARARVRQPRDLPQDPIFMAEPEVLEGLVSGRNAFPAFADLEGDGRPHLIVGMADGRLLHFRHAGGAATPRWERVSERFAGYGQGRNPAPAFADLDGDGDLDLAVGNERGQVHAFENTGAPDDPRFTRRPRALRHVNAGRNAAPAFADLDGDGTPELLVGNLRGSLFLYRRTGEGPWAYELVMRRFLGLDLGFSAAPLLADLTMDGRAELLVGTDRGPVRVWEPSGTSPLASTGWRANRTFLAGLDFPAGSHPAVADVDGDGDPDLAVGSDGGPLRFFRNHALVPETVAGGGR